MSRTRVASGVRRPSRTARRRLSARSELGQTAIVAVMLVSLLLSLVGAILVETVSSSYPLQQAKAVAIYANRALEAGQNAYLTAVNANPSLAQCSTDTNGSGTCSGIDYGEWNLVPNSDTSGSDAEYYAFGNPQPVLDKTTNALDSLSVQVVGAAQDNGATNHYLFDEETLNLTPSNGFLTNVWWSNYESYSSTGSYTTCNYNWDLDYDISNKNVDCSPVYFGPSDYLYGPVYSNDSIFVSGNGQAASSPSFGTSGSPSTVTTADPNCQFVDATYGMAGSDAHCSDATSDVATYNATGSSYGHAVEQPPASDSQLATIAGENGCLYSGPTQITLSGSQMTVVSPDTVESQVTVNGTTSTWDNENITTNLNSCPNDGTASIPPNGVVYVENVAGSADPQTVAFANPFDDPIDNTVTNLASSPSPPVANSKVVLTATVTSQSNQANSGASVSFSQTTKNGTTSTAVISGCSTVPLSGPQAVTPATTPPTYTYTATCPTSGTFTESKYGTGAFSATYSGGTYATSSSASLGQTYTFTPSFSFGPDAQTSAGGCTSCYYGESSTPDAEGDAFVNGSLSGQLTIGTANDVVIDGNITYADCSTWEAYPTANPAPSEGFCPYSEGGTNDSLGLIANNYVEVGRPILASTSNGSPTVLPSCGATPGATCDPSDGTDGLTIDAAILALTQSFVVNNYADGGTEGNLILYGSIQQYARGPVGMFSGNNLATGYQKHYTWDPLLDFISPPSYLVPSTPSWELASVVTNAGVGSTNMCPPLLPVYGSSQPITTYCSASTGGLPGYPAATAPSAPTIGTATSNANGTVTVTWTAPVSTGGSAITGYTVAPSPGCTGCSGTSVSNPSATSTTISGLTPGSSYTFSVAATNAVGTSSPSSASDSITVPSAPAAPTNVSASTNTNGSVTVSWIDPSNNGSTITGYGITPAPSCSGCTYSTLTGATISSATVTGLTQGTSYTFTVTATNAEGTSNASSASNAVTAPSVPGAPVIGTATVEASSAKVTWTAPSSNGGSAITGYVVTPYVSGTAQSSQTFTSTATTETVTSLTNGTAYTFKVAAINGVGTGAMSAASNSVTPVTVPGAPTIGTATASTTTNAATVTWTAPASNGGATVTGYVVTPYLNGTTAEATTTFTSTATSESVTNLTKNDKYTFKVAATNTAGTGTQSAASTEVDITK